MIRERKAANPAKPFFLYFAHGAVHAPLHAKPEDIGEVPRPLRRRVGRAPRRRGRAASSELGVIARRPAAPAAQHRAEQRRAAVGRPLRPRSSSCSPGTWRCSRRWSTTSTRTSAAWSTRSRSWASSTTRSSSSCPTTARHARARRSGTTAYYVHLLQGDDIDADFARARPHRRARRPRRTTRAAGRWLGNTPFRLYKINTHQGGHSVPFIVSWPDAARRRRGRESGASTPTSPTCCRRCSTASASSTRPSATGSPLPPVDGTSFARRSSTTPTAPSRHPEQLYEMNGHRGYYRDGWEVVTLHQPLTPFDDEEWELYHLDRRSDRARTTSRPSSPSSSQELAAAWEDAAWAEPGLPARRGQRHQVPACARARDEVFGEPVTHPARARRRSSGGGRCSSSGSGRFTVTVELDFARRRPGDASSPTATRARATALYVLDDELVFVHNDGRGRAARVLRRVGSPPGAATVEPRARRRPAAARGTSTLRGRRRGARRRARGRADALRHRAVRGHRRRHRPPLAGVVGDLRASSARSRTPARCDSVRYEPGRARPRRARAT